MSAYRLRFALILLFERLDSRNGIKRRLLFATGHDIIFFRYRPENRDRRKMMIADLFSEYLSLCDK